MPFRPFLLLLGLFPFGISQRLFIVLLNFSSPFDFVGFFAVTLALAIRFCFLGPVYLERAGRLLVLSLRPIRGLNNAGCRTVRDRKSC
jgi:hypothetical protein